MGSGIAAINRCVKLPPGCKGKHEVQFGGEILRVRLPMGNQYQESGVFDFENLTGSPLADFELGAVSVVHARRGTLPEFHWIQGKPLRAGQLESYAPAAVKRRTALGSFLPLHR